MAIAQVPVVDPPKEELPVPTTSAPLQLTGWDHIAIVVPDLVEAERWYVDPSARRSSAATTGVATSPTPSPRTRTSASART